MISNICNKLGEIKIDKSLHFIVAYIIFDVVYTICNRFSLPIWLSITIAFIIASIALVGKELIDEKKYNGFDWYDIFAGYLGILLKLAILSIMII